jgi:glycosyltransferase involved in cell wall biosynthesis
VNADSNLPDVVYVVDRFPAYSETFIVREIEAVTAVGVPVRVFAMRQGRDEVVHAEVAKLLPLVRYAPQPWGSQALRGLLIATARHPLRLFLCLLEVARTAIVGSPREGYRMLRGLGQALAFAAGDHGLVSRVHAHFAHRPADVARHLAQLLGVPWSVSIHAWDVFAQPAGVLRRRLTGSDRIFACTRSALAHVTGHCPELAPRCVLMYHGIDLSRLPPVPPPGELLLAVGRLERKKGFDVLIEALGLLRDDGLAIPARVVGDGHERANLERSVSRLGLGRQVRLTGSLSQECLARMYARAFTVVVPSRRLADGDQDGLPNVVLEALAFGRPVVASAVGGIPELVVDDRTGLLVPPDEPRALATAIGRLVRDGAYARSLGRAGATRVRAQFDARSATAPLLHYFQGDVQITGS